MEEILFDYIVTDSRPRDKRNILFATNEKDEAIEVANESGEGTVVIIREIDLVVYTSPYKSGLPLAE